MIQKSIGLSISCVIYDTDCMIIKSTLESLNIALQYATEKKIVTTHTLYLINNYPQANSTFEKTCNFAQELGLHYVIQSGHGNIGYARGNNLAIADSKESYHLVLNPDVIVELDAIAQAIEFLENNSQASLVAPHAVNENGNIEYLAKREPSPWIIFLRGFNNRVLNKIFKKSLDTYAYKDLIPAQNPIEIELASGCFMCCRGEELRRVSGFSVEYFLYFEDFDLSRKLRKRGKIYHHPQVKITHAGGHTARKGLNHIKMFLTSYWIYRKLNG
jgi:GT2 family glycosyltransferase